MLPNPECSYLAHEVVGYILASTLNWFQNLAGKSQEEPFLSQTAISSGKPEAFAPIQFEIYRFLEDSTPSKTNSSCGIKIQALRFVSI